MKARLPCTICGLRAGHQFEWVKSELHDDFVFEIECPYGHKTVIVLEATKFSVLFDLGAFAYLDGYTREAVSNFASATERLYEFFIKVMMKKHNISWDKFAITWKKVSNQSERQLGAFLFMYLLQFGEPPNLMAEKMIQFRNSVIHKGYIPTNQEVLDYGDSVYDHMLDIVERMESQLRPESINAYLEDRSILTRKYSNCSAVGHSMLVPYLPSGQTRSTFRQKILGMGNGYERWASV